MPQELKVNSVNVQGIDVAPKQLFQLQCSIGSEVIATAQSREGYARTIAPFTLKPANDDEKYVFDLQLMPNMTSVGTVEVERKVLLEQARAQSKMIKDGILVHGKRAMLALQVNSYTLGFDVEVGQSLALKQASMGDDICFLNIYLSAVGILETRGEATDSFARVTMVTESQAEYEMGRTEILKNELSPEYRKYIRIKYAQKALSSDTIVRIEICDPVPAALETVNNFTVIGATQLKLTDLHEMVSKGMPTDQHPYELVQNFDQGLVIGKLSPQGTSLMSMELKQVAVLQDLVRGLPVKEVMTKRAASIVTKRRAVLGDDIKELREEENKKKKNKKKKDDPEEMTPKENADAMMRTFKLGTLVAAFESVQPSSSSTALILSASGLTLNNCSFAPDPYLRVYKKLPTGKDKIALPAGAWAPYRCPIYKTKPQFKTRSPVWGQGSKAFEQVVVPNDCLVNTDGTPAELIIEAWDFQKRGKDRLIGRAIVPMQKVRQGKVEVSLEPTTKADKQDALDMFYMYIGCGIAKKAGTISVAISETPAIEEAVHSTFARFDMDHKLSSIEGKVISEPLHWQPLLKRRTQFKAEMTAGEEVLEKGILKGLSRWWRDLNNSLSVSIGVAFWHLVEKYAWLYQTQMTIGAEFGSAIKALFVFMGSILVQNLLLLIFWAPAWLPQSLFVSGQTNIIADLFSVFTFEEAVSIATGAIVVGNESGTETQETVAKGIFFFSGYMPTVETRQVDDNGDPVLYPIGVLYLVCAILSLLLTVTVYTIRLFQQIRYPKLAVSSTSALPAGTAVVLNAMFGGWDFTKYNKATTHKIRREIITRIKEGEADADREMEKAVVIMTRAQRNVLFFKRLVLMSLGILLTVVGVVVITFFLTPNPFREVVVEYLAENVPVIGPFVSAIAITFVNSAIPLLMKILVKAEAWPPAIALRQELGRNYFVKIVNGLAIFYNLELVQEGNKPIGERTCIEKTAAETVLKLLITDVIAASLTFTLPKWLKLTVLPWLKWKLCGRKKAKTDPSAPTAEATVADKEEAKPEEVKPAVPEVPEKPDPSPPASPPTTEPAQWTSPVPQATTDAISTSAPAPAPAWAPAPAEMPVSAPPSPPASPDGKAPKTGKESYYWPDGRPKLGKDHPKAPNLLGKLPKEVMEIIYRQLLLFIGMMVSPWLFGVGFLFNLILYVVKFYAVLAFHRRPKSIKEYFGAGSAVRDFYIFMLITSLIAWVFFFVYASLPANPICGPLRTSECAAGFENSNLTSCLIDLTEGRRNYDVLTEYLLPPAGTSLNLDQFVAGNQTLDDTVPTCDVTCVFQNILAIVVRVPVLLFVICLLVLMLTFSQARALRTSRELREAKRELSIEYADKRMALRYAGVSLS